MSAAAQIDPTTGERVPAQGTTPQIDPVTGERITSAPASAGAEPTGGVSSFFQNLLPQAVQHPIDTAKQEWQNEKTDASNLIHHPVKSLLGLPSFDKDAAVPGAIRDVAAGNPAQAAVRLTSAVPGGQGFINAAEKPDVGGTGSYLGDVKSVWKSPAAMGSLLGADAEVAPLALGGADVAMPERSLLGEVPTRAKAGKLFQGVMGAAADQPVNLTRSGDQLLRVRELADNGTSMPQAAGKLLRRVTDPGAAPLTYRPARDFASNISRLSANDTMRLSPPMQREIGQLRPLLNADVGDAATAAGKGAEYDKAMKMYSQASRNSKIASNTGKLLLEYGLPGGVAYEGYKAVTKK